MAGPIHIGVAYEQRSRQVCSNVREEAAQLSQAGRRPRWHVQGGASPTDLLTHPRRGAPFARGSHAHVSWPRASSESPHQAQGSEVPATVDALRVRPGHVRQLLVSPLYLSGPWRILARFSVTVQRLGNTLSADLVTLCGTARSCFSWWCLISVIVSARLVNFVQARELRIRCSFPPIF